MSTLLLFADYSDYLMVAVGLAGVGVGAWQWIQLDRPYRFATAWLAAEALFTIAAEITGLLIRNSQVTAKIWFAASVVLACEMCASLQRDARDRNMWRLCAVAYVVLWLGLVLTADPLMDYSKFLSPLHSLLLFSIGMFILSHQVSMARRDLASSPRFLLGVGFIGYAVPSAFKSSIALLLIRVNGQSAEIMYGVANVFAAVAMVAIVRALYVLRPRLIRKTA